jgi:hypothetical protein
VESRSFKEKFKGLGTSSTDNVYKDKIWEHRRLLEGEKIIDKSADPDRRTVTNLQDLDTKEEGEINSPKGQILQSLIQTRSGLLKSPK